jgi:hypothetical protein
MSNHPEWLAVCLMLFTSVFVFAEDKLPRIKPEEARQHVGKKVEVVFEVKAAKHSLKRKTVYLDSELDFNSEKNLGIAITEQGIADLKQKRNVDEPAEPFRGKMIRVVGMVVMEDERPYIKIDDADQIHLHQESSKK